MTISEILPVLAQSTSDGQGNPLAALLMPMLLIIVAYIFIIQRPQTKERQKRLNQLQALKKGDEVVSIGGICGKVESIDKENKRITVAAGKNVSITFLESAIDRVIPKEKGTK